MDQCNWNAVWSPTAVDGAGRCSKYIEMMLGASDVHQHQCALVMCYSCNMSSSQGDRVGVVVVVCRDDDTRRSTCSFHDAT
mmetsp:Transcript_17268/g.37253  ORF Transcript_17268/g.37253 Transcript_17268/m.37253 type:complete len:81 (+) Transcript_17268:853-1095(+)